MGVELLYNLVKTRSQTVGVRKILRLFEFKGDIRIFFFPVSYYEI